MKFSTVYDGEIEIFADSINRNKSDQLGQESLSLRLERSSRQPLSEGTQLALLVASETTQDAFQFFAGWLSTQSIKILPGGTTWEYNLQIKGLLDFEDNEPIENYYQRSYFSAIAQELINLSGANNVELGTGIVLLKTRFIAKQTDETDINSLTPEQLQNGLNPKIITFEVKEAEHLSSCLQRLCNDNGWTVRLQKINWLSIENLGNGFGALGELIFIENGAQLQDIPPKEIIIDDSQDLCEDEKLWEGEFSYTVDYATYSGALVIGKGGDRVLNPLTGYAEKPRIITVFPEQINYSLPELVSYIAKTAMFNYPDP